MSSSPPPQQPSEEQSPTVEWAEFITGRYWEIFWKNPEDEDDREESGNKNKNSSHQAPQQQHGVVVELLSSSSSTSSTTGQKQTEQQKKQETMGGGGGSGDLDDKSRIIKATEENEDYSMIFPNESIDNVVDICNSSSLGPAVNPQMGKEGAAETEESSSSNHQEDEDDDYMEEDENEDASSSSVVDHVDDWYEAKIESFSRIEKNQVKTTSATTSLEQKDEMELFIFKITFVGDDHTTYEMKLTPDIVRPSARAWMKRTFALLAMGDPRDAGGQSSPASQRHQAAVQVQRESRCSVDSCFDSWVTSLPPDTSVLEDLPVLNQIRETATLHDFVTLPGDFSSIPPAATTATSSSIPPPTPIQVLLVPPTPTVSDLDSIRELAILLRHQMHLRSRIAAVVEEVHHHHDNNNNSMMIDGGSVNNNSSGGTTTSASGDGGADEGPTEVHLNHLTNCLKDLESSCLWYCRCWALHSRIFSASSLSKTSSCTSDVAAAVPSSSTSSCTTITWDAAIVENPSPYLPSEGKNNNDVLLLLTPEYLLHDCLDAGRRVILSTFAMDLSVSGSNKRKRKAPVSAQAAQTLGIEKKISSSPSSSLSGSPMQQQQQRRTKRRRTTRSNKFDWNRCNNIKDADLTSFFESLDEEHFISADTVKGFTERIQMADTRWFLALFGTMLRSISNNVVVPFVQWKRRTEYYLGDTDVWDVEEPTTTTTATSAPTPSDDGETSDEESERGGEDNDSSEGVCCRTPNKSSSNRATDDRFYVKYEDIEASLEIVQKNPVLRHLQLADYGVRLRQKLSAIDSFAQLVWQRITSVFDDDHDSNHNNVAKSVSPDNDQILKELKHFLLMTRTNNSSSVANVEPFGRSPSPLTRTVIQNAIECRSWYLRLILASSSVREQGHLVQKVISDLSILPTLPLPQGVPDMAARVALVTPRVEALAKKLSLANAVVSKYNMSLSSLTTIGESNVVLQALRRSSPFVSEFEELVATRMDALAWEADANSVLSTGGKPAFPLLADVKRKADLILQGKSETRLQVTAGTEGSSEVDLRIREFALQEMSGRLGDVHKKVESLYSVASVWKDRADSVITTLRLYGNKAAGDAIAAPKLPAMVDLKRVRDLIVEHESVPVDLTDCVQTLTRILSSCLSWASSLEAIFGDSNLAFEECLRLLREHSSDRPAGIIMNPTRQVIDSLEELLVWYTAAKSISWSEERVSRFDLLVEGIEVLEIFCNDRHTDHKFTFSPAELPRLIAGRVASRVWGKAMSSSKLQSNPLSSNILSRVVDDHRDAAEGYPLLHLLHMLWLIAVADFNDRCLKGDGGDRSLTAAVQLMMTRPLPLSGQESHPKGLLAGVACHPEIQTLTYLISDGESTEAAVRDALSESRILLRECLRRSDEVRPHMLRLKSQHAERKGRHSGTGLTLNQALEQQLDHEVKVFNWLSKAFQYPVLLTRETDSPTRVNGDGDHRVPWEVLVSLYDKAPQVGDPFGDFAYVVLHVKELHEAAAVWQEEISSLTMLSLRGAKRRGQSSSPSKAGETTESAGTVADDDESSNQIDLNKVAELSNNPVLWEVHMPRQNAIQTMLGATSYFEVKLHEFLGKDYDGICPDRAAYPQVGSLVGNDGSFLLLRLTGSPLFATLKVSIMSISDIAGGVFADTPGKATFDWIRLAVSWIESLHAAVVTLKSPQVPPDRGNKLVIPYYDARRLLSEGESILLNVPDDLRRTLSKHKIYVSTNKDGKLTVKSKKGGAHHAVGVTAIRWCPFLFDSLKADVARLEKWQKAMGVGASAFMALTKPPPGYPHEQLMLDFHGLRDEFSELIDQAFDMVIFPVESLVENSKRILLGIDKNLAGSTPAIAAKYAAQKYKEPQSLIQNRFLLLDSLIHRNRLDQDKETSPISLKTTDGPFRCAARVLIQNALSKGLSMVGEDASSQDALAMCAVKAWEIESEFFSVFQSDEGFGESKMAPGYRDQARSLKRSLEDPGNVAFFLRVLTGQVGAEEIARMSTLDLANPKTKEERARAAASQKLILDCDKKPSALKSRPAALPQPQPQLKRSLSDTSALKSRPVPQPPPQSQLKRSLSDTPTKPMGSPPASPGSKVGRTLVTLGTDSSSFDKSFKLSDVVKNASASSRPPPPPPSLAASLVCVPNASKARSKLLVSSSSGGDRFNISVPSVSFVAGFYVERDDANVGDGLLPENWNEKGRLSADEFTKFLRKKLEGGKWSVLTLRLTTFSDKDAREYRKYYKEYENRQRISMFALNDDGKVFLVTPKFHRAARGLSFENSTRTYAVALVRR